MNLPTTPARSAVNTDPKRRRSTLLQGRWLTLFRLAWVLLSTMALIIFIASLPVYFASNQASFTPGYTGFLLALSIFVALVWFIVAVLIFWRKSNDWLALLVSVMLVLQGASTIISPLDVIPSVWQVLVGIVNILAFDLLFLVFCLFPTGRLVPRWILLFGVPFLGWEVLEILNIVPQSNNLLSVLLQYVFLGSFVVAQLYRYHSVSSRTERQQTKWIVFGVTVTYLIELGVSICVSLFPSFFSPGSLGVIILSPLADSLPILIPLSFGFAILHSRLWEIDVIINRTLVYGTLTALLAMIYFGCVIGLQSLLHGLIESNQLAIVGSTLAIAALFQPLRRRIQRFIDRRFYRRKYDAARTLASFSATLRNEVDLKQVSEQLMAIVQETMQPTHISLWLNNPEASSGQKTRLLPRIDEESVER